MLFLVLTLGGAQVTPPGRIGGTSPPINQGVGLPSLNGSSSDGAYDADEARRLRMLNGERQRSLVADTVKLVKLANELNAEMAKEPGTAPTPAELRKVADIEKLAHSVKEKMEITVIDTPVYRVPNLSPIPY